MSRKFNMMHELFWRMNMWQKFLFLGLAGASGTLARYWLSGIVQKNAATDFPLGTAAVNIVGCLFFGLLWAFMENRLSISGQTRIFISGKNIQHIEEMKLRGKK